MNFVKLLFVKTTYYFYFLLLFSVDPDLIRSFAKSRTLFDQICVHPQFGRIHNVTCNFFLIINNLLKTEWISE